MPEDFAIDRSETLGQALDTLTAILRVGDEAGQAAALAAAMREGRIAWQATTTLAERHLLLPALWPALLEKNLVRPMPPALRRFMAERGGSVADSMGSRNVFLLLEDRFSANAARNRAIRAQLGAILSALNLAGVVPGVIKGSRLLLAGDGPFSAGRILRDIDLLLAPGDWAAGVAALRMIGYRPAQGDLSQPRHGASLAKSGEQVEVDLHVAPLSLHEPMLLPAFLTAEGFWQAAETIATDGMAYRRLPPAESLLHGIVHTEIADLNHAAGDWVLRYLYETAVLTRDPADPPDWSVLRSVAENPVMPILQAHLHAAQSLFGAALPEGFVAGPAKLRQFRRCRRNLLHPGSSRRISILAHKFRQAMSKWYLRRKGYYSGGAGTRRELWWARARMLRDLLRQHGPGLARSLSGGEDDPLPPPRV